MGYPLATLRKTPDVIRIYGHRGARGVWPENTFLGIKNAFDLGLQAVELDVLVTKDLIPVVTHNAALEADTTRDHAGVWLNKRGPKIYDLTYADLQQYYVGAIHPKSEYATKFPEQTPAPQQKIPALAEIAAFLQQPAYADRWLNIEIRGYVSRNDLTPPPKMMAQIVMDLVSNYALSDRVIMQSFDWRILEAIAQIDQHVPRGHLSFETCEGLSLAPTVFADSPWMSTGGDLFDWHSLPRIIHDMGGRVWSPHHQNIDATDVAEAHEFGILVNPWGSNEPSDIMRMIDAGVDGIITDYPARVQSCLRDRNLRWRERQTPQND